MIKKYNNFIIENLKEESTKTIIDENIVKEYFVELMDIGFELKKINKLGFSEENGENISEIKTRNLNYFCTVVEFTIENSKKSAIESIEFEKEVYNTIYECLKRFKQAEDVNLLSYKFQIYTDNPKLIFNFVEYIGDLSLKDFDESVYNFYNKLNNIIGKICRGKDYSKDKLEIKIIDDKTFNIITWGISNSQLNRFLGQLKLAFATLESDVIFYSRQNRVYNGGIYYKIDYDMKKNIIYLSNITQIKHE